MKIYLLAQAARDVSIQTMSSGQGADRKRYVANIVIKVGSKFNLDPTPPIFKTLLKTFKNLHDPYAQQVEKAFLLAIRSLYRSIDACRTIARPLSQQGKRDSPAFAQLRW